MALTDQEIVAIAARNNSEWCDIVCRAHGLPGVFDHEAWTNHRRTPPFYPDAVTLQPSLNVERMVSRVDAASGCTIKDSFASVDLSAHGFRVLFDAEWIHRPAQPPRNSQTAATRWTRIADPECTHRMGDGVERSRHPCRTVPPRTPRRRLGRDPREVHRRPHRRGRDSQPREWCRGPLERVRDSRRGRRAVVRMPRCRRDVLFRAFRLSATSPDLHSRPRANIGSRPRGRCEYGSTTTSRRARHRNHRGGE